MKNRENAVKIHMGETGSGEDYMKDDKLSLMEKLRIHYNHRQESGAAGIFATKLMYLLMAFQAPTQLYMIITYVIPVVFNEYDDWTQYCLKVVVWFMCLQGLANFFCVILYDTSFRKTKDRPSLKGLEDRWENPPDHFVPYHHAMENGSAVHEIQRDESGMTWEYCSFCDIKIPPRAHHCNFCQKCILKRDHHCFMVGTCIGYRNQRYFVVLAFYAVLCGIGGGMLTYSYLKTMFLPTSYAWTDFLFPVAIYRWLTGAPYMTGHYALLMFHLFSEFVFGFIGFIYFTGQVAIIAQGLTLYELTKRVPVKSFNTINYNFRSVFGDFWALNFVFPMQIIFRQREDGTKWEGVRVDYNANLEKITN